MPAVRAFGHARLPRQSVCSLVAIARDEGSYIAEWLAFHLAVGFARILVFDHGSIDNTAATVERAARREPAISLHHVPDLVGLAPQLAAYRTALPLISTPWVAFFDIDEFLVPWRDGSVSAYLDRAPDDVAAVHVNWRSFGSSGLTGPGYGLVTEAFERCAEPDWQYQMHYKTIARTALVRSVNVHDVELSSGRRALSDFTDVYSQTVGIADRIVYDGIQLNHYQSKTRPEFNRRMQLPRAAAPHLDRMTDRDLRFAMLDRNEIEDHAVDCFLPDLRSQLDALGLPAEGGAMPASDARRR